MKRSKKLKFRDTKKNPLKDLLKTFTSIIFINLLKGIFSIFTHLVAKKDTLRWHEARLHYKTDNIRKWSFYNSLYAQQLEHISYRNNEQFLPSCQAIFTINKAFNGTYYVVLTSPKFGLKLASNYHRFTSIFTIKNIPLPDFFVVSAVG